MKIKFAIIASLFAILALGTGVTLANWHHSRTLGAVPFQISSGIDHASTWYYHYFETDACNDDGELQTLTPAVLSACVFEPTATITSTTILSFHSASPLEWSVTFSPGTTIPPAGIETSGEISVQNGSWQNINWTSEFIRMEDPFYKQVVLMTTWNIRNFVTLGESFDIPSFDFHLRTILPNGLSTEGTPWQQSITINPNATINIAEEEQLDVTFFPDWVFLTAPHNRCGSPGAGINGHGISRTQLEVCNLHAGEMIAIVTGAAEDVSGGFTWSTDIEEILDAITLPVGWSIIGPYIHEYETLPNGENGFYFEFAITPSGAIAPGSHVTVPDVTITLTPDNGDPITHTMPGFQINSTHWPAAPNAPVFSNPQSLPNPAQVMLPLFFTQTPPSGTVTLRTIEVEIEDNITGQIHTSSTNFTVSNQTTIVLNAGDRIRARISNITVSSPGRPAETGVQSEWSEWVVAGAFEPSRIQFFCSTNGLTVHTSFDAAPGNAMRNIEWSDDGITTSSAEPGNPNLQVNFTQPHLRPPFIRANVHQFGVPGQWTEWLSIAALTAGCLFD